MRFVHNKKKSGFPGLSVVIFALAAIVFVCAVSSASKGNVTAQRENLESAINRAAVYCYALEGNYPESLDYIKEHYGLYYDESLFYVDYNVRGANIFPDITVIQTGAAR